MEKEKAESCNALIEMVLLWFFFFSFCFCALTVLSSTFFLSLLYYILASFMLHKPYIHVRGLLKIAQQVLFSVVLAKL